jgi:hypothetical protein
MTRAGAPLAGDTVFAPLYRRRGRLRGDVKEGPQESLRHARGNAGGPTATPAKIVVKLMYEIVDVAGRTGCRPVARSITGRVLRDAPGT